MTMYAMVLVASLGQMIFEPICPAPIYVAPTDYIYLRLDGMSEFSRSYEIVDYGSVYSRNWKKVPVINGYVPEVNKCRLASGGWQIIYDYSQRIPLFECTVFGRESPKMYVPRIESPARTQKIYEPVPVKQVFPDGMKLPSDVPDTDRRIRISE